jgi:hypothetical protein
MALPPLLTEHIEYLRSLGCNIEVKEDSEICIIFKDYPVPSNIWNCDKTDLLVVTHPTYPNAKMDMFWVDPPIALKSGAQAQAVSPETKCGRSWLRFSWHVQNWNPAHDNLITYLNVVDDRLKRNA